MTTIKIKMNDNETFIENVENYSPERLTEELNGDKNFINIGKLILQRFSVVHVTPVTETENESESDEEI